MGTASVDDLNDISLAFLAASIDALNKTPEGAPERAFVSPGEPAMDCCPQLSVHTQLLHEVDVRTRTSAGALGAAKQIIRGGAITVTLSIMVIRCVPGNEEKAGRIIAPPPEKLQAAAALIDSDGWALWLGLTYALKHGDLKDTCSGAERLGGTKLTPQGGCGGWVFQYRVPIEGGILS